MLNNIIKSDTKALGKVFGEKEFLRSKVRSKEGCLVNLISETDYSELHYVDGHTEIKKINAVVALSDNVSLNVFTFIYEKDPLILPILLKYFTHKNLLQEVRDDLDKINQNLQIQKTDIDKYLEEKDELLKNLWREQYELQNIKTRISYMIMREGREGNIIVNMLNNKAKEIDEKIIGTSSEIEKIEQHKKEILNPIIEIVEKELAAYARNNKDYIEKVYQSLNSRAQKTAILDYAGFITLIPAAFSILIPFYLFITGQGIILSTCMFLVPAILFAAIGMAFLAKEHYKQSFEKEIQDFIGGPKYVDKVTQTENGKELKQEGKEQRVENLIDLFCSNDECNDRITPLAPPFKEEIKESYLYPNLEVPDSLSSSSFIPFNTTQQMR